jgi:hypothetical protein
MLGARPTTLVKRVSRSAEHKQVTVLFAMTASCVLVTAFFHQDTVCYQAISLD